MTKSETPFGAYLQIITQDNDLVVRFNYDGTLTIGHKFSPDEAGMRAAEIMAEFLAKFARGEMMVGFSSGEDKPAIQ